MKSSKAIFFIADPNIASVRTKYRRYALYTEFKNILKDFDVFWVSSYGDGIDNPEIYRSILKGYEPWLLSLNTDLRELIDSYKKSIGFYTFHRYFALADQFDYVHYDISDNWVSSSWSPMNLVQRYAEYKLIKRANSLSFSSQFLFKKFANQSRGKKVIHFTSGGDGIFSDYPLSMTDDMLLLGVLDDKKYNLECLNNISSRIIHYGDINFHKKSTNYNTYIRLKKNANLVSKGYVEKEELKIVYRDYNVVILPYGSTDFCLGIYPLKIYELIANSLIVVFTGSISVEMNPRLGIWTLEEFSKYTLRQIWAFRDKKLIEDFVLQNTWQNISNKVIDELDFQGISNET